MDLPAEYKYTGVSTSALRKWLKLIERPHGGTRSQLIARLERGDPKSPGMIRTMCGDRREVVKTATAREALAGEKYIVDTGNAPANRSERRLLYKMCKSDISKMTK